MTSRRRRHANNSNDDDDDDDENGFGGWGGYMEAKKAKLLKQYNIATVKQNEKLSEIFKSIAIYVNGLTNPNADELKQLMAKHGGIYHTYQSNQTTHIIASNLPNVKIKQLGRIPIVKPSWITDSISLEKLLDYRRYLLYTNQSTTQPKLDFPIIAPKIVSTKTTSIASTKTASDPNFLEEFYNNSRLHLIATLGAEFKQLVGQLREKSNGQFLSKNKLIAAMRAKSVDNKKIISAAAAGTTVIMHIDMDCFFVSVGLRNRPELKGKPVAVTHARNGQMISNRPSREAEFALYKQRLPDGASSRIYQLDNNSSMSEIASCSYEARKYGITNGMFLGTAIKLCPNLVPIPYDFEDYKQVSNLLYQTIAGYTLDIEAVSCDEMYVDITKILQETGLTVDEWAKHIRKEIMTITNCECSTGFGANRLQARLATKKAKPCGQFYLKSDNVELYMSNILLADLPGVGQATLAKLQNLNLITCGDIQITSLKLLQNELGMKNGETLYEQAKGIDRKPLNFYHERKSVSAEVNYGIRFKSLEEFYNFLQSLSNEVHSRLLDINMKAKCLTLKLMVRATKAPIETAKFMGHGVCDNLTKSTTFNTPIDDATIIFKEAKSLYIKLNVDYFELRGIGLQLTKLEKLAPIISNTVLSKFLKKENKKKDEEIIIKTNSIEENQQQKISNLKIKKQESSKGAKNKTKVQNKNRIIIVENSLNNFFNNKVKSATKSSQFKHKSEEIDLNVLNELPEDLRNEIIEEYQLLNNKIIEEIPPDMIKDVKQKSLFDGLNWEQLKPVLKIWIETELEPNEIDIEMLGEHFRQLAIDRKIEMLQIIFNFLFRRFSVMNNCKWHKAYFTILNKTQEGMIARYGNILFAQKKFKCCCSKSLN